MQEVPKAHRYVGNQAHYNTWHVRHSHIDDPWIVERSTEVLRIFQERNEQLPERWGTSDAKRRKNMLDPAEMRSIRARITRHNQDRASSSTVAAVTTPGAGSSGSQTGEGMIPPSVGITNMETGEDRIPPANVLTGEDMIPPSASSDL